MLGFDQVRQTGQVGFLPRVPGPAYGRTGDRSNIATRRRRFRLPNAARRDQLSTAALVV